MVDMILFTVLGSLLTTIRGRILLISTLIGASVAAVAWFALAATNVHDDVVIAVGLVIFVAITTLLFVTGRKIVLSKLAVTNEQHRQLLIGGFITSYNNERNDTFKLFKTSRSTAMSSLNNWWDISNPDVARETAARLTDAQVHTEFADDVYHNLIKKGIVAPVQMDFANLKPATASQEQRIIKGIATYSKALEVLKKAGITEEELASITTLAAWDYGRVAFIARYSAASKFITEAEAWSFIQQAATNVTAVYDCWKQYVAAYIIGRAVAYGEVLYIGSGKFSEKSAFAKVPFK